MAVPRRSRGIRTLNGSLVDYGDFVICMFAMRRKARRFMTASAYGARARPNTGTSAGMIAEGKTGRLKWAFGCACARAVELAAEPHQTQAFRHSESGSRENALAFIHSVDRCARAQDGALVKMFARHVTGGFARSRLFGLAGATSRNYRTNPVVWKAASRHAGA